MDRLQSHGWGYAAIYLNRCNEEFKFTEVNFDPFNKNTISNDEIDIEVYSKLVQLDKKLGKTASEQLFDCLFRTTRPEIIKV